MLPISGPETGYLERDRLLLLDGAGDAVDDVALGQVDEDVDGAPAGEPDLEGLLVGDPVRAQARRLALEDGAGLVVDGGLDTAARDGADDLPPFRHGQHGAGLARRRPLRLDDRGHGHPLALREPALQRAEDVLHAVPAVA